MRIKKLMVPAIILGVIISIVHPLPAGAQEEQEESEVIYIPPEVKAELKKGMEHRTPRLDIPFVIFEHFYLPARENIHSIFLFKAKNENLDFTPPAAETEEEAEAQQPMEESSLLVSDLNAFLWFDQLDGDYEKEVYIPFQLQEEKDDYDPEEEPMYSAGYPLPPGKYLLSMAITSKDLQEIGTQYFEFELPSPVDFQDDLDTTPVFFARDIQQMEAPETTTEIHKGFFTYSILRIEPVLENVFAQGEHLDVFFYVFGAQPDPESNKFNLTANYELVEDDEVIVRYAEASYDAPIISQPLPLERTVLIQKKKGEEIIEEKKETRDVEPGEYTFIIQLQENVSGKSLEKNIKISVVEEKE
ncbi:MAG: hypothetical protein R6V02_08155 [Candidatus Aminicenantes bacterium]